MTRATSPLHGRVAFLVGVRRSGTNWLRRIVDAHPDACVIPGETYLLSHGIAPLVERVQHGLVGSARTGTVFVDRDDFLDGVRDLCDRILGGYFDTLDTPARLVAERTPDHVRVLDLVADVYPDAKVVHIIRDGRDVARSLVSQSWGPETYADAAAEWVSGIESARAASPRLGGYLEVPYEALLADPAAHVPALYQFLGLDAGDELVRRALAEADVPYNVDPAATAVTAAKWKGGLTESELDEVLSVAGPLLAELGYEIDEQPSPGRRRSATVPNVRDALAAAVGSRREGRGDDAGFQRELLRRFDATMAVLDDLLGDMAARRFDRLGRHFSADARVRVLDGTSSWDERGPGAVARLAAVWSGDPALQGRQVRGDVHPGAPAFTVVATWQTGATTHDRVLVVTRYGDHIDELTWYVLPRVHGDPGSGR